jgi:hypothetical protein
MRYRTAGSLPRRLLQAAGLVALGVMGSNAWSAVPSALGWHELAGTRIRSVCPSGVGGDCAGVTTAWGGGTFDSQRNRLLVWGGGHSDYFGNEVYAVDLDDGTVQRLNDPSPNPPSTCSNTGVMPDGKPTSRHTYNHLAYIAHADRMFAFGGSNVPCGFMLGDTWTLNLANLAWQKMNPSGPSPEPNFGRVTAYDPATRKVYIHDQQYLYSYTFETNTYARLSPSTLIDQYMTATIDTKRNLFVIVGRGSVYAYSIAPGSSYTRQTWSTTGDTSMVNGTFAGLAYDPVTDRIVAWSGGNTVYSLNPDTKVWTAITYSGGPGAAMSNGTYGRFAYSAASNAFVVVNSVDRNAFALRLSAADGTPPKVPQAPSQVNVQ